MTNKDIESGHSSRSEEDHDAPTEESPLLPKTSVPNGRENDEDIQTTPGTASIISLLLIGVFVGNADALIVLSTYTTIASEFNELSKGSWLSTSFLVAACASQPVAGRLSDIYGRKSVLLASYSLFVLGTLGSGIGMSMNQIIAGRLVAGIGGGSMAVLVSIIITDIVPKLHIAAWRSYVNIAATLGRSLGGPLGGWLADSIGWRWGFISQVPLVLFAMIFIAFKLKTPGNNETSSENLGPKLSQVDFVGALLIVGSIVTSLLILDLGGQRIPWSSPVIVGLAVGAVIFIIAFCWYDSKIARLPIFSPGLLLKRDVWTSYSIAFLMTTAQVGMMFSVPMYFQVTEDASLSVAGLHFVPAVLGNTIGGLVTGFAIAKTGRYKFLTILAVFLGIACYLLMIFRWNGRISFLESLEIIPGGIGSGMAVASAFVVLTSNMARENMAMAAGGMYLATSIGIIAGTSMSFAIQRNGLRLLLQERLPKENSQKIIREVLSDISIIKSAKEPIKSILINSYVKSIEYSHVASLACSILALLIAFCIREHRLKK